jgi:surfactin synthase thioesterase subunit
MYSAFYTPKIQTPMLHFIGSMDTVVDEKRSLLLAQACETEKVVYHPGGHFLPSSQKEYVGALVGFMREVLAAEQKVGGQSEERAEDMDLPF